ncbi:hypothetical protein EJD97_024185, partial [Solanum chilense]
VTSVCLLEMNTKRMASTKLDEGRVNEEVPPQVKQVLQGTQRAQGAQGVQLPIRGQGNEVIVVPPEMTNREIRDALLTFVRAMTTHVNRGIERRVNVVESTMTTRLRDFVRMNPPIFLVSKWEDFKEAFLGKYFPHEMREVKVEEFINLKSGPSDQNKPWFKKRAQTQDELQILRLNLRRGREAKQVPLSVPGDDVPRKNHLYALRARGSKTDDEYDIHKL